MRCWDKKPDNGDTPTGAKITKPLNDLETVDNIAVVKQYEENLNCESPLQDSEVCDLPQELAPDIQVDLTETNFVNNVNYKIGEVKNKLRVCECFSGIGAQHKALSLIGRPFEVIGTSEWNIDAIIAYKNIHYPNVSVDIPSKEERDAYLKQFTFSKDGKTPIKDVTRLKDKKLNALYVANIVNKNLGSIIDLKLDNIPQHDLLTYSFPCTSLSLQGKKDGMSQDSGTASSLIWKVQDILEHLNAKGSLPTFLLMENVPEICNKNNIGEFNKWISYLDSLGYETKYEILNAVDFDQVQSRRRCFALSTLRSKCETVKLTTYIKKCENALSDILEDSVSSDYIVKKDVKPFIKSDFKLSKNNIETMYLSKDYSKFESDRRVIGVNGYCPTITCAPYGIKILDKNNVYRHPSIKEIFRLMGFEDSDFQSANNIIKSKQSLYKQAGNSICVNVLKSIFSDIGEVFYNVNYNTPRNLYYFF